MATIKINFLTVVGGIVGVLSIAGSIISSPFLQRWYSRWGTSPAEVKRHLPGDDLVAFAKIESTRALSIRGRPKDIWPWLVQLGYRRAGWYSYDFLEIVAGAAEFVDGLSARRIISELQILEPGSQLYTHPRLPAYVVDVVEANRLIILVTRIDTRTGLTYSLLGKRPPQYFNGTRVYFLEQLNERETRLLVRSRQDYSNSFVNTLVWRVLIDPISFVMERKMLLEIKKRVETNTRLDWQAARKLIGVL
jgi:hypothetical protein